MGPDMFRGLVPALITIGIVIGLAVAGAAWVLWHFVLSRLSWN